MLLDDKLNQKYVRLAYEYIDDAKKQIDKKGESHKSNMLTTQILQMSELAFNSNIGKLRKKIEKVKDQNNQEINELGLKYLYLNEYLLVLAENQTEKFASNDNPNYEKIKEKTTVIFKKIQDKK